MQMRDVQEELVHKDTELHKMEVDLVSADEERKRSEDQVSSWLPHSHNTSGCILWWSTNTLNTWSIFVLQFC